MMATVAAFHATDEAPGVVASPERIDAWMRVAKAGDTFLYATRACLPVRSVGAKRMYELATRGLVCLTRPRSKLDPTVFNYTATRTSKVSPLTKPERPVLRAPIVTVLEQEADRRRSAVAASNGRARRAVPLPQPLRRCRLCR